MIPKVIHYCWFGKNPKPPLLLKCLKSWKKYCPDYEIIEWNESNYDYTKNQYMKEAYEAKKWGFVPDYARLDIIYNYGGFYLDTDVELIKSLDTLLNEKAYVGIELTSDDKCYIALGLGFGAEKNNEIIKLLRDSYNDKNFKNIDGSFNLIPSPLLNTESLEKNGYKINNELQRKDNFTIFPSDYFCPKSFSTGEYKKTKNTISIHHYAASWYTEEQQIQYRKRLKEYKKDRLIHTPNRILKKLLGERKYERMKKFLKR